MAEPRVGSLFTPVRQATTVHNGREQTFDVFVGRFGEWWPFRPFALEPDNLAEVRFERARRPRVRAVARRQRA